METLPQNETGAFKLYHFAQMEISDISEILNSTDRKIVSAIENVSASLHISVKLDEASIKKLKELKRIYNEPEIPPELHDAVIAELKREEESFLRAKYKKERNMMDIACAISWSLAFIIGAVAAIAEPPQIDEPTPINVVIFFSVSASL